jgi:hypothetical protein
MASYTSPTITNQDAYDRRMAKLARLDGSDTAAPTQQVVAPPMSTGLPAQPAYTPTMSTGLPPQEPIVQAPPMSTGLPPQLAATGGNQGIAVGEPNPNGNGTGLPGNGLPTNFPTKSTGLPPQLPYGAGLQGLFQQQMPQITQGIPQFSPDGIVQNTMKSILDPSNPYIARARQRALDMAGDRGLLNSSIAAGNAEGAAIDAAMPLVNSSLDITNRRETQAFNQQQAMQNAQLSDWLASNNFNRSFTANLAMLPINNATDLSKMVYQQAMSDPETYTPGVISGMSNFFNRDMLQMLQTYFPNMFGGGG